MKATVLSVRLMNLPYCATRSKSVKRWASIKDPLKYMDDDSIILKKYQSGCIFCDNARG